MGAPDRKSSTEFFAGMPPPFSSAQANPSSQLSQPSSSCARAMVPRGHAVLRQDRDHRMHYSPPRGPDFGYRQNKHHRGRPRASCRGSSRDERVHFIACLTLFASGVRPVPSGLAALRLRDSQSRPHASICSSKPPSITGISILAPSLPVIYTDSLAECIETAKQGQRKQSGSCICAWRAG